MSFYIFNAMNASPNFTMLLMKVLALLLGIFITLGCKANSAILLQETYEDQVRLVLKKLEEGKEISSDELVHAIPSNRDDAAIFYAFDYDESTSKSFQRLNKLIVMKSKEGDKKVLTKYILLSEFVDGYFAEAYFDEIETISKNESDIFCEIYISQDSERVTRLKGLYQSNCN
ncbi:hypothetical protein [Ekhidna sp.]